MKKMVMLSLFVFINSQSLSAAMTKEFIVTKLNFNQDKKYYQVDFKNQAGVYNASGDELLVCLQQSLREKKAVMIEFNPMGLKVLNCSKVSSK